MIELTTLLRRFRETGVLKDAQGATEDLTIRHLTNDSRAVGPGSLFAAIRGEKADGHLFIDKAVKNGAIAIVCEAVPEGIDLSGTALVRVSDARAALAESAALFYGEPARELRMVGVTGTNGKSTTTYLLHHVLQTLGKKAGLIGTIATFIGKQSVAASMTTPDATDLHRLFREMADAGCKACVMEVSSHALDQQRVRAVPFEVGVFTNLTQDHLDYHKTFEQYRQAKKRLFIDLESTATAVYNMDDPSGGEMVRGIRGRTLSYGRAADAGIRIEVQENAIYGLRLRLDGKACRFKLVGLFNAYNLAAAYGTARALGYGQSEVLDALAEAEPVPGRFEQIRAADGTTAIIDYAHTPDALENVLTTVQETKPPDSKIWCVFGCGGDRDVAKRPMMGGIAERYADHVVVTSDNPRTEDPQHILDDIRPGLRNPGLATWMLDRREAIRWAAEKADPGDVVLVAGKGHEDYQIIGAEKVHFDDREEIRAGFRGRDVLGKRAAAHLLDGEHRA